ncbi:hypothetical protein OKW96_12190 [Sphingobacterium sp. KU25419]|nr:hypothetical protein OKW96_12190 [Sphingobacterium sp. KU25419]
MACKFTCEVDGIAYKDQTPYILPPGAKRTPTFNYHFDDSQKGMYFSSRLALVNKGQSDVGGYAVMIDIPLEAPLEINKEYQFAGISGENHRMPINYLFTYREKGLAYCNVYANGEMNYNSFGTGKLIISLLIRRNLKWWVKSNFLFLHRCLKMNINCYRLKGNLKPV